MMRQLLKIVFVLSLGLLACDITGSENPDGSQASFQQGNKEKKKKDKDKDKDKKKDKKDKQQHMDVTGRWEMPKVLTEISGITWLGTDKIAAVQDEVGVIFIYDLVKKDVEDKIPFSGKGDYEGIAAVDDKFYVLRSDGLIVEVKEGEAKPYKTHLSAFHDAEGLFYDKANNRLLVAVKANDPVSSTRKGIYSFDLSSKKMSDQPVMFVDLEHPLLGEGKKMGDRFQPSDLAIHPVTGEVYVIDGANSSLLVMDQKSEIKAVYKLDRSVLKQPEGITFSPSGDLYISSEGAKERGVIVKVDIHNKESEVEL